MGLAQHSESSFRQYGYLAECAGNDPPIVPMKFDAPGRFKVLYIKIHDQSHAGKVLEGEVS